MGNYLQRQTYLIRTSLTLVVVFYIVLSTGAFAKPSPFVVDTDVSLVFDDNLSQGDKERDIIEDHLADVNLTLAYNKGFGSQWAATFKGFVEGQFYETADELDRMTLGTGIIVRWQPAFGFLDPIYKLSFTAQEDDYSSDQRDSTVLKTQLSATRRITDRLTSNWGGEYRYRDSDSTVFDTRQYRLFANLDWVITDDWITYATYSYVNGDMLSSAQTEFCNGAVADDIYPLIQAANELEIDEGLTDNFCGTWVTYQLDGHAHSVVAGLNHPVGRSSAIDASVLWAGVDGRGDNDYDRRLYRLSLLIRW